MQKRTVFGALVAVLAAFLGVGGTGFAQVEITECRQVVPRGQAAVLTGDLDCPTGPNRYCVLVPSRRCDSHDDCPSWDVGCMPPMGVTLDHRATLELNGHTISGGYFGVYVPYRGAIRGPGQIVGSNQGYSSSRVQFRGRLEMTDVMVDGGHSGIWSGGTAPLYATNVTANNTLEIGIFARTLKGSNITANGNGAYGIIARDVKRSTNITVNSNGWGSWGGYGISASSILATDVEARGNTMGGISLWGPARLTGLVSMDNGGPGLESSGHAVLVDSTLSGNDTPGDGIDILSGKRPRLSNTTCSRSERIICERGGSPCSRAGPWGVCSLD